MEIFFLALALGLNLSGHHSLSAGLCGQQRLFPGGVHFLSVIALLTWFYNMVLFSENLKALLQNVIFASRPL